MRARDLPAEAARVPSLGVAVAGAAILGAVSLVVRTGLGYDVWAWIVWGREMLSLDLATTGGPSWKPLPALLNAPLALLGDAAPYAWLAFARAAAIMAVLLAYRVAARIAGPVAGVAAAVALVLSADFYVTALRGYSEPLLIALVLAAADRHLSRRPVAAVALLALAGLVRPEAWLLLGAYGAYAWWVAPAARTRAASAGLVLAAPVIWLGLDWLGSGDLLESSDVALNSPAGSAARAEQPVLEVLVRALDSLSAPVLVFALVGFVLALRRRSGPVVGLSLVTLAWVGMVAVMAAGGYTGRRRYLALAAALACVVAGVGIAWALRAAFERRRELAAALAAAIAVAIGVFSWERARSNARLTSVAGAQADQLAELGRALDRAGGARRTLAVGDPTINAFLQTALAWKLEAPIDRVQATWSSTAQRPNWRPPSVVFRAPARLAGPRPVIAGRPTRPLAAAGRWRVLLAPG